MSTKTPNSVFKTLVSQNIYIFSKFSNNPTTLRIIRAKMKEKYTWEALIITETKSHCFSRWIFCQLASSPAQIHLLFPTVTPVNEICSYFKFVLGTKESCSVCYINKPFLDLWRSYKAAQVDCPCRNGTETWSCIQSTNTIQKGKSFLNNIRFTIINIGQLSFSWSTNMDGKSKSVINVHQEFACNEKIKFGCTLYKGQHKWGVALWKYNIHNHRHPCPYGNPFLRGPTSWVKNSR